jgi:hypothetical protein
VKDSKSTARDDNLPKHPCPAASTAARKEFGMFELMIPEIARREYEERLQEAAMYRRMKRAQRSHPGVIERLLLSLSQFLIDVGYRLKQRVEMRPA